MSFLFPPKIKRIIVTGGLGFIGSNLVCKILLESNIEVINIDKVSYCSDETSINKVLSSLDNPEKRYKLIKLNLSKTQETIDLIVKIKPDLIIHLAAESHVDRSIDFPNSFSSNNIISTLNLLEASRKYWNLLSDNRKSIFRFHHISTDEVFGSLMSDKKFNEKSLFNPRSPYSASKAASDHLVKAWYHTYGLPVSISNCSNNYGPWQFPEKLIPLTIFNALRGISINLYGDGKNVRDWIFIEDHLDGLLLVAFYGTVGESYCIGSNSEKTNNEVVEKICEILDGKLKPNITHKSLIKYVEDRPGHDRRYAIDSSKIVNYLKWSPKYNFEIGITKTIDWYLSNQIWVEKMLNKSDYKGGRIGLIN